jgi:16S rRNA (uracil1498-N3)-methyltransferase
MRRRFFVDRFDANSALLQGDAADHLGRVLRAGPGQLYELSDGTHVWLGRVNRVALSKSGKSEIAFELIEPIAVHESTLRLHLLLSIVKFDRFEWCLEKATELGVSEITPLAAARTDKPLLAAASKRHARWEKILLESAQQARRLRPPTLREPIRPADSFARCIGSLNVMLSEREGAPAFDQVLAGVRARDAVLAIGPEGGWTDEEIAAARAARRYDITHGDGGHRCAGDLTIRSDRSNVRKGVGRRKPIQATNSGVRRGLGCGFRPVMLIGARGRLVI